MNEKAVVNEEENDMSGNLIDEIDSLISEVGEGGGEEVVEQKEEPKVEEVAEETEREDSGSEKVGEEPSPVHEAVEEEAERREESAQPDDEGVESTGEGDPLEEYKAIVERQQKTIDELSAKIAAKTEPEPEVVMEEKPFEPLNLSEEEFEELQSDPKKFMEFLANREARLMEAVENRSSMNTLKSLPAMVMRQVQYANSLNQAVTEFWRENQDLSKFKKTVGVASNEVYAEHPDWTIGQVFDEAGKRVREMLGVKKQIAESKPTTPKKPAFAKQKGGNQRGENVEEQPTSVADEIDQLFR